MSDAHLDDIAGNALAEKTTAEKALEEERARRAAIPAPSYERLEAYAQGKLPPEVQAEVETALEAHPSLRGVVDAMRAPDPALRLAVQQGLRQARRQQSSRARAWLFAPAVVLAMLALFVLVRPGYPPAPGESELVAQGLTFNASIRSQEGVRTFKPGDVLPFTLTPPPGSSVALILEVSGSSVEKVDTLKVSAGETVSRAFALSGDDALSFLVVAYADAPLPTQELLEALTQEAARPPLLTSLPSAARAARVKRALTLPGLRLRLDVSECFQVKP